MIQASIALRVRPPALDRPGRTAARASLLVLAFGAAAVAAATTAWTALGLAGAGRFDASLAIGAGALSAGAFAATCARAVRRGALMVRLTAEDVAADVACAAVIALAALRLGPAVPWPAALDGGWYAAAAVRIAHDRRLSFDAPAAAVDGLVTPLADLRSVGIQAPEDRARGLHAVAFAVPRIGVAQVAPYHPPLFSALAAVGVALDGPYGSATAAVWSALLWLLAIAALARASGLRVAAPAATALAALTPQFRVYGATPYAELFAGSLALAALVVLAALVAAHALADDEGGDDGRTDSGSRPRRRRVLDPVTALAAAAGIAAGSAVVAKVDLAVFALLTAAAWLAGAPTRRARAAFVAGAALTFGALIALAAGPTAVYAALNGHGVWRLAARFAARWGLALLLAVVAAAVAALSVGAARRRLSDGRRGTNRSAPAAPTLPRGRSAAVGAWTGARQPARPISRGAILGTLFLGAALWQARTGAGEPIGMLRLLTWSVTPLALFAAAIALAWLVDDAPILRRAFWPLVLASLFVLAAPIVTRDLSPLYTARRLAPIAVPTACLLAAIAADRAARGSEGVRRAAVAALAGLTLAAAALQSAPLRPSREFAAAQILIDRIARYTRPGDLALFPSAYGGDLTARLAAPLWALHDVDVAVLPPGAAGPETGEPGAPAAALARWWAAHPQRRVLWVAAPSSPPPAGLSLEALGDESLISEAWLPGIMPPALAPIELSVAVGVLSPAADNSR